MRDPASTPPPAEPATITTARYALALAGVVLVAIVLRFGLPHADPPWHATVGIVWHDEGAWVHNARNKALFGAWQLDQWNPMYLSPVFTGLQYVSFQALGVGLWQARVVSEVFGALTVLCLALASGLTAGRRSGVIAGLLLATNYVWVMWNRVALLETVMVAFLALSAAAYVRAHRSRGWAWGLAAGLFAVLAFFAKAAAAFFLAALALEAAVAAWRARSGQARGSWLASPGAITLAGLAISAAAALVVFVVPNWDQFQFYNWQMSVTRKPDYSLRAFLDRASWFPIVHDFFTRMWMLALLATAGLASTLIRLRQAPPLDRLSAAWIVFGCLELVLHDVGNERRLVMLIPPMVVLAASVLGHARRLLPASLAGWPVRRAVWLAPAALAGWYLLGGAAVRLGFLYDVRPAVRLAAALAVGLTLVTFASWRRMIAWCSQGPWRVSAVWMLVALMAAGDLAQFGQWLASRTDRNYQAMKTVGEQLPPGTLVQGKLANGLALESRIRPVFVGRGFGNYADRLDRTDIRYALTYLRPRPAYEGRVMLDVLARRPWRIVAAFPVAESTSGDDEAALIEFLDASPSASNGPARH